VLELGDFRVIRSAIAGDGAGYQVVSGHLEAVVFETLGVI